MGNLALEKVRKVSTFRKIAIGTWKTVGDPTVYGTLEVTMDQALDYMAKYREATGQRITISHLMAKACGAALQKVPETNSVLRFNRIYRRQRIGVFFQVAMVDEATDEIDLSGAVVYDVEQKSLGQIADDFSEKVSKVRNKTDVALEKTRNIFNWIPYLFLNSFMWLISFLSSTLNLRLPGVPVDPFGSILVTNVGSLGIDQAFVPLVPYSRVPLILAVGSVNPTPVVEEGAVVIRQRMKICESFDHRFIDGVHIGRFAKVIEAWLSEPEAHFGPIPEVADD